MKSSDLLQIIGNKGYFVEAGAHDGIGDSTTYCLEQAGWTGICVEPSMACAGIYRNRKCYVSQCALWHEKGEVEFRQVKGNQIELSGIEGEFTDNACNRDSFEYDLFKVQTKTLTGLLDDFKAPNLIDYLSLDTEGTELKILRAHDFTRYNFKYMSVEHNGNKEKYFDTRSFLSNWGYDLICPNEIEDWFKYEG